MIRSTLLLVTALTLTACSSGDAPFAPSAIDAHDALDTAAAPTAPATDTALARPAADGTPAASARFRPAGDAALRVLRSGDLLVSNIGSSGADGVDVDPPQVGQNFALNVPTRPYDLAGAEFTIRTTSPSGAGTTTSARYDDASSPYLALHASTTSPGPQTVDVRFLADGALVRTARFETVDGTLPVFVPDQGTVLVGFGARGNARTVQHTWAFDAATPVRFEDTAGQEQTVYVDRIVIGMARPTGLDDVHVEARPVRKDSGEAHLDYLIITMENVMDEEDPIVIGQD